MTTFTQNLKPGDRYTRSGETTVYTVVRTYVTPAQTRVTYRLPSSMQSFEYVVPSLSSVTIL